MLKKKEKCVNQVNLVIETKTKGKDNFALGSDFGQPEILTCGAEGETLINETLKNKGKRWFLATSLWQCLAQ